MQPTLSPARGLARWLWITGASIAAACFVTLGAGPAQAQSDSPPRLKTESPYFFVKSDDPQLDQLPLKSTRVDVRISGVIADVTVTQRYKNEGQRAIEARYVFPGSTRAAVYGMNVRLADRLITANIREKQQARIEYDSAKKQGKTAALLEQHLPNVFQMNVANIMPGDDVQVELRYTELLVPQAGNYQFVFPTVVGPRYNSPQSSQATAQWVSQPFLPAGQAGGAAFDIQVAIASPIGLKEVRSSSHAIEVTRQGDERAAVSLQHGAQAQNNRDFILDYRLAGERIESGVMLFRGSDENFFLAMVEPPKQVPASLISPREYIFVVDISGSMHGFPLDTAKVLLRELIGNLKPSDSFNVLLFSGSNRFLSPHSVPATRANIEQAVNTINQMGGGGSTELIPALKRVYAESKAADVSRTVVVVTDGYVTVEREAFELVRRNLSQANLFSFGIGSSVNRHLMEGLARAGMGEPFIVTQPAQAAAEAARFRRMIESPVLTSVKARFEGLDVYDVEPAQLPDVLGERPVVVFGKWRGEPRGQVVIEGQSAAGPYRNAVPVGPHIGQDTAALRYLWARHRIAGLSDQEALEGGDGQRKRITELGLQYNLLTQYTSFLAVDQVVRNPAPGRTQRQPAVADAARREQPGDRGRGRPGRGRRSAWHAGARHLGRGRGAALDAGDAGAPRAPHRLKETCIMVVSRLLRVPGFVRLGILVDTAPGAVWLALLAAALWPTAWWMGQRMLDGSDEPLGLLALAALSFLLWHCRRRLRAAPRLGWLALALAAAVASTAALSQVPPLVSSLLGLLALGAGFAAFLPPAVATAPVLGLSLLSLPLLASLQFYAGYPLRVLTAEASRWLLAAAFSVQRSGASLLVDGHLVIVDAPCSGVQMLWLGYFTACVVALHAGRRDPGFLARLPAVSLLVLAGNVLRNSSLVAFEASGHRLPGWAHEAAGLAVLAAVCAGIARVMHLRRGAHHV